MNKKIIRGFGGGGKGAEEPHTPVEAPDTLHSVAYARIIDLISEGEIGGMTLKDVYLNYTPIQNADDSLNFKGVSAAFRTGTQEQEPIEGFPDLESETAVGVELTYDTPWTHEFTNLEITSIGVRLAVNGLSEIDTETGDTNGYLVEYAFDMAVDDGPYIELFQSSFDGKSSSTFEKRHVIPLPAATSSWRIRVRRLTENSDSNYVQDDTFVMSYTEMIAARLRFSNSAVVGLIVDATQFRSIPNRAYRPYGILLRVPANYDPDTRTYATVGPGTSGGIWDGTFKVAWSNNPAWVYYDAALALRYGLGRYIGETQINKWALYRIAQYCDEMVDDGKGGEEPRFTCDIYLQKSEDAYKVMQDLASVFRGISYWAGGMIEAVCDMPADPVYSFTNANVIDGRFSYQGSSRQARHTVALVAWSDPSDFGRGKIEYVPYEEGIARYGVQPINVTAFGATSQGQAHRVGRWVLLTEMLETNTVTFEVGLDGSIPQPGQIIRIADKLRQGVRKGGRVRSATTSVITLDKMPTANIGDTLTVILPSGLAQTRTVSAVGTDTLTVGAAYDAAPVAGAAWVLDSPDMSSALFKVLGVRENAGDKVITYTVMAVMHVAAKFDQADFGFVIQQQNQNAKPPNTISPPATVTVTLSVITENNVARNKLTVSWSQVQGAVEYEVSVRRDNENWSSPVRVQSLLYEVDPATAGNWKASVKAINATGLVSLEKISDTTAVPPPPNLEQLIDFETNELLIDYETGEFLYNYG